MVVVVRIMASLPPFDAPVVRKWPMVVKTEPIWIESARLLVREKSCPLGSKILVLLIGEISYDYNYRLYILLGIISTISS